MRTATRGTRSEGLRMKLFPAAMATGSRKPSNERQTSRRVDHQTRDDQDRVILRHDESATSPHVTDLAWSGEDHTGRGSSLRTRTAGTAYAAKADVAGPSHWSRRRFYARLAHRKLIRSHDWKRCRRARAAEPQFDRRMYVRELILSSPRRSACWLLDEPSTGWGTAAGYYRWRRTTQKPSIDALSKRHLSPRAMIPSISRELLVA